MKQTYLLLNKRKSVLPISKEDELEVAYKICKLNETIKKIRETPQDNNKNKSIYLTGFDSPVKSYINVYDNMKAIRKIADWVEDLPESEIKALNFKGPQIELQSSEGKNKASTHRRTTSVIEKHRKFAPHNKIDLNENIKAESYVREGLSTASNRTK